MKTTTNLRRTAYTGYDILGQDVYKFVKRGMHPDMKDLVSNDYNRPVRIYRDKDGYWLEFYHMWFRRAFLVNKAAGERLKKYIEFMESL